MTDAILLLGASGFIGRRLASALASRGEHVIAAGLRVPDGMADRVRTVAVDPADLTGLRELVRSSRCVVHAASASTPASTAGHPVAEIDANLRPTAVLLEALHAEPGRHLVYLSSAGTLYGTATASPAIESTNLATRSYHGAGKAAAEFFIAAWCAQADASATILRPSNVYGPGQPERAGFGIIPAAMGRIARRETLSLWGDGSAVRDYLYVDDLVALCVAAINRPLPGCRIFNAGSGQAVSINQLLALIEAAAGRTLEREYLGARAVDASRVEIDSTRAREALGWHAETLLPEGLKKTWDWFNPIQH